MGRTVLTGRALQQYLARHPEEDAPGGDPEDALLEFLTRTPPPDNPGNTAELSRDEILAALSATQSQVSAA
jgi:hypothetical protein